MPPVVVLVSVVLLPAHMVVMPFIVPGTAGSGFTVIVAVTELVPQLLPMVYAITEVPLAMPDTCPVAFTVATDVLLLLHTPPAIASVRFVLLPAHIVVGVPVIGAGNAGSGFIVTIAVTELAPQLLLMV